MSESSYDVFLRDLAAVLHITPALLRQASLAFLVLAALLLGVALSRFFNQRAKGHRNRPLEIAFSVLAVLPIPVLLIGAVYFDLNVLALTIHGSHIELLQRASTALMVGAAYYLPTRIALLFLRRWGQKEPRREKITRLWAFLFEAAVVLVAVYTLLEALGLAPEHEHFGSRLLLTLAILLGCYGAGKMVTLYLSRMSQEDPSVVRFTEPAVFVARGVFGLLALMIILENLGVRLTAVWTTLGVGSVAVAMALQETLSNFFAGLYLLADRPIETGDYVQLDSGHDGYVIRVGWRSTLIRSIAKNLVVVPNSTLAKAVITNFSHPERRMIISIEVGVAYGTDPRRARRVLQEIAVEALSDGVQGLNREFEPQVRFMPGFGDSSLNFTLLVEIVDYADQFHVQTELRTRIVERFQREGIEFPFPTRTLILDKSTPELLGLGRSKQTAPEGNPN